jgi:hypothetical protein
MKLHNSVQERKVAGSGKESVQNYIDAYKNNKCLYPICASNARHRKQKGKYPVPHMQFFTLTRATL